MPWRFLSPKPSAISPRVGGHPRSSMKLRINARTSNCLGESGPMENTYQTNVWYEFRPPAKGSQGSKERLTAQPAKSLRPSTVPAPLLTWAPTTAALQRVTVLTEREPPHSPSHSCSACCTASSSCTRERPRHASYRRRNNRASLLSAIAPPHRVVSRAVRAIPRVALQALKPVRASRSVNRTLEPHPPG